MAADGAGNGHFYGLMFSLNRLESTRSRVFYSRRHGVTAMAAVYYRRAPGLGFDGEPVKSEFSMRPSHEVDVPWCQGAKRTDTGARMAHQDLKPLTLRAATGSIEGEPSDE